MKSIKFSILILLSLAVLNTAYSQKQLSPKNNKKGSTTIKKRKVIWLDTVKEEVEIGGGIDSNIEEPPIYKYGVIDTTGKEILPVKYDYINCNLGSIYSTVVIDGKLGYLDSTGKEIISPKYHYFDNYHDFSNGYARVSLNRKYGFIDINGREIIPPIYNDMSKPYDIDVKSGYVSVNMNGKWGYVGLKGRKNIPTMYEYVKMVGKNIFGVRLNE
jgi:hypothetical protein